VVRDNLTLVLFKIFLVVMTLLYMAGAVVGFSLGLAPVGRLWPLFGVFSAVSARWQVTQTATRFAG
jgi:hypothetical protein